jgi:eukaryotic translation initiation factor 2C
MNVFSRSSFGARVAGFVKGVRVQTKHLGYKKTVKTLSPKTARTHRFRAEELGRDVTVEEYFQAKYKIKLQFPDMPLVDVGGKNANLLPPELCEILPDQPFRGKLTDEHTAQMILVAAKPPNVNAMSIVGPGLRELGFNAGTSPQLNAFGMSVGDQMAVVPGRILPPPGVKYGQGTPAVDDKASWNLRAVKFAKGAALRNWIVLVIRDGGRDEFNPPPDPELPNTVRDFMKMCRTSGMTVDTKDPAIIPVSLPPKNMQDPTRAAVAQAVRNAVMQVPTKPSIALVILSSADKHVYNNIKHMCDVGLDLATVCVQAAKIRKEKGQLQYFANVALKFNMKLGGVKYVLSIPSYVQC